MTQYLGLPLKLVVISNPCETWNDLKHAHITRELFTQMIDLKLAGYTSRYDKGTLPLDATDFFCTHLLLCTETNGRLDPVLGYKSVTFSGCQSYHHAFPILTALKQNKAENHASALEELIGQHLGKSIRYCSSYTIRPKERSDKSVSSYLKDVMVAIQTHFIQDSKTELSILCGVPIFKVDQMFMKWGYVPLRYQEKDLPPFYHSSFKIETRVMYLKQFSSYAFSMAEKYQELWNSRLQIGVDFPGTSKQIAA